MEAQNGVAGIAIPDVVGDQNEKKRSLADEDEHDSKRVKTASHEENSDGAGLQNGTELKDEVKAGETAVKPLSKGTAPVKAE